MRNIVVIMILIHNEVLCGASRDALEVTAFVTACETLVVVVLGDFKKRHREKLWMLFFLGVRNSFRAISLAVVCEHRLGNPQ